MKQTENNKFAEEYTASDGYSDESRMQERGVNTNFEDKTEKYGTDGIMPYKFEEKTKEEREKDEEEFIAEISELNKNPKIMKSLHVYASIALKQKFNKREIVIDGVEIINNIIRKMYFGYTRHDNKLEEEFIKEYGYRTRDREKFPQIENQIYCCIRSEVDAIVKKEKNVFNTLQLESEINEKEIKEKLPRDPNYTDEREKEEEIERNLEKCENYLKKKGRKYDLQIFKSRKEGKKNDEISTELGIEKSIIENRYERIKINLKKHLKIQI